LATSTPALVPLAALVVLACTWPGGPKTQDAPGRALVVRFAAVWLLAFGFVTGPVASTWSGYYYTLFAIGGALLRGLAVARLGRFGFAALAAGLLWWHAAVAESRAFATESGPWVWSSHLTSWYFQRASALTDVLSKSLLEVEPRPPHDTRFFFATL